MSGESITSPDGRYSLRYATDNLLVQLDSAGTVVWDSPGTPDNPGVCILQRDGNLVIYNRYSKATWATATRGATNVLHIEDSGSIQLRAANTRLWTNHP